MKRVERGSNRLPRPRGDIDHVHTCKRCDHIVAFPEHKIGLSAYYADEAKRFNYRIIKRESRYTGGLTYGMREVDREDMDSCMRCCNSRGHDCDEPWTDARCQPLSVQPTPFTICDMYGMEIKWGKDGIVIVGPRPTWYVCGV